MLKKLKSASRERASLLLPLAFKALAFSVSLAFVATIGGFFAGLLFLFLVLYFYFKSFVEIKTFLRSYFILIAYSLIITNFTKQGIYVWLLSLFFGALFFILIGVKNLVFASRRSFFGFFVGVVYFLISVTYYVSEKGSGWSYFLNYAFAFFALYLVLREVLDFIAEDFPGRRKNILAFGSAFLMMQIMGAVMLLPLGFLSSSALTLLFLFVLEDLISYHVKGGLSRQAVVNSLIIMSLSLVFILGASKWTL